MKKEINPRLVKRGDRFFRKRERGRGSGLGQKTGFLIYDFPEDKAVNLYVEAGMSNEEAWERAAKILIKDFHPERSPILLNLKRIARAYENTYTEKGRKNAEDLLRGYGFAPSRRYTGNTLSNFI